MLAMVDGEWMAYSYLPVVPRVAVGNAGLYVPFTKHGNGTWTAVNPGVDEPGPRRS